MMSEHDDFGEIINLLSLEITLHFVNISSNYRGYKNKNVTNPTCEKNSYLIISLQLHWHDHLMPPEPKLFLYLINLDKFL